MTILVTGASGHIGRPLVDALLKRGERVRILDRNRLALQGVEIIQGDICNPKVVDQAMDGVDIIYHLAAIVDYGPAPRSLMYEVNVNGTKNIVARSKAKRLIYLSTTSVYGKRMRENPASERTPIRPDNFYGKTKAMAERLVLDSGGMVLRSPVIYGPGFNQGFGAVVSGIRKEKMRIVGSGDNPIQWIHISDLIAALLAAKDKGKGGEIYLVAGREARTQKELFALLASELGVPPPEKSMSRLEAKIISYMLLAKSKVDGKRPKLAAEYIDRIASDRRFDFSKAHRELGFDPKGTYEQGAREIVAEYLADVSKQATGSN